MKKQPKSVKPREKKKDFKHISTADKMAIVSTAPEVQNAIRMLYGLYKDMKCKSFVRFGYTIENKHFELTFQESTTMNYK